MKGFGGLVGDLGFGRFILHADRQGAESKQGEEGNQKRVVPHHRPGSQASEAKPAERMLRVSGITASLRCVCVTLPALPWNACSRSV